MYYIIFLSSYQIADLAYNKLQYSILNLKCRDFILKNKIKYVLYIIFEILLNISAIMQYINSLQLFVICNRLVSRRTEN